MADLRVQSGMKQVFLFLLTLLAFFSTLYAQRITLQFTKAPPQEVFRSIEKQSGYFFTYTNVQLQSATSITIKVRNVPLIQALDSCLSGQPLTYEIIGKSIILVSKPPSPPSIEEKDSISAIGRINISGMVFDKQTGLPLPRASISFKGSVRGIFSDENGLFALNQVSENSLLEFSFIGYISQTILVDQTQTNLQVGLQPDSTRLENAIINTGLYRRPVGNFTGASFTAEGGTLKATNPTNVVRALSILDPSVRLTENYQLGSDPNLLPVIQVRGQNNLPLTTQGSTENALSIPVSSGDIMAGYIANPNEPIIILDGFQTTMQSLYDIDINRIERITVLKDAAATVAYGSRAANGVVVVETKRPVAGRPTLTYSINMNLQWAELSAYSLMNADELLEAQKLAGIYSDTTNNANHIALNQWYDQRLYQARSGVNTDWLAQPVRTGFGLSHSLNLSGGAKGFSYSINLHYNNLEGSMQGSQRRHAGLSALMGYSNAFIRFTNHTQVLGMHSTNSGWGNFAGYARQFPYFRPYDSSGKPIAILEPTAAATGIPIGAPGGTFASPLNDAYLTTLDYSNYQLFTNSTLLEWNLRRNLKLTGRFHLYRQSPVRRQFLPPMHSSFTAFNILTEQGSFTEITGLNTMYEGRLSADYNFRKDRHTFYVSSGISMQETSSTGTSVTVTGFPNDYLPEMGAAAGFGTNVKPFTGYSQIRSLTAYGSLSYSYNNLYLLEATGNASGSSQFGDENRLAPFGAIGAGINLHNTPWLIPYKWLQQLRIFATYGVTGNQNFAAFMAQPTYQYNTQNNYRLQTGASLAGFANNNLKWQQTRKTNFALDGTFLNDLFRLRFDYYIEKTGNLILPVGVAPSTGFVSYQDNLGTVKNTGYEILLTMNLLTASEKGLGWQVTLNGGHYKNKIESLSPSIEALNNANNSGSINQKIPQPRYEVGQSMSRIWAVKSLGIDPATGNELFQKRDGTTTFSWDPLDKIAAGDAASKFKGTLASHLEYRGLSFGFLLGYEWGGQIYNQTLADKVENVDLRVSNGDKRVLSGRWQQPGDHVSFKSIRLNNIATSATTRFVQDNNYMEAASLSAGYVFPQHCGWVRVLRLQSPRVYITHNNAFRISSAKTERGTAYPFSRSFNLGFTTSF